MNCQYPSLDALWADWSDIVVAYALSDFPLGVVALGFKGGFDLVTGRDVTSGDALVGGSGSAGDGNGAGRRAHMNVLSLLRFANTQTGQGCR